MTENWPARWRFLAMNTGSKCYDEYYVINDWDAKIFNKEDNGDSAIVEADIVFTKTIKVRSVSDLLYIRAVVNVQNSLNDTLRIEST